MTGCSWDNCMVIIDTKKCKWNKLYLFVFVLHGNLKYYFLCFCVLLGRSLRVVKLSDVTVVHVCTSWFVNGHQARQVDNIPRSCREMGAHRLLRSRVSVGQTSNRRPTLTGPRLFCRSVSSGHRALESSSGPEVTGSWRGFLCRKKHANVDWHSTVFGPMRDLEYFYFLPLAHSHEKKLRNIYQAAQFMKTSFSKPFPLILFFSSHPRTHFVSLSPTLERFFGFLATMNKHYTWS